MVDTADMTREMRSQAEQLQRTPSPFNIEGARGRDRKLVFWPLVVLVVSLVFTFALWRNTRLKVDREILEAFHHQANDFRNRIGIRLASDALLLKGFEGLFNASRQVTRQEFGRYFQTMQLADPGSGFAGVAYHEIVSPGHLAEHVTAARSEGFSQYRINPPGVRSVYAPLTYIEPLTDLNAKVLGFDPLTIDVERQAVERARDEASVSISSKLTLAQDAGTAVPGFVMYVPLFRRDAPLDTVAQRRAAFVGWVDAPFRMKSLMTHVFPEGVHDVDFEIYDGSEMTQESLLYDSTDDRALDISVASGLHLTKTISFGGHHWTLAIRGLSDYGAAALRQKTQLVGAVGTLLSALLSLLLFGVMSAQRRRAAREQRDAAELAAASFESQEGKSITDAYGVILSVNRAFSEITGYSAEEVLGQNPRVLKSGRHDAAFYEAMWQSIINTGAWQGEIWNRHKNGTVYPQKLTISAVKDAAGVATHYVGSFSDITATKAAEQQILSLAFSDLLTGLPNRRMLISQLHQIMATVERHSRHGALLLIDLDKFKDINEAFGHAQGDLVLQHVARQLSSCLREGDILARLGADEFVVLLAQLDEIPLEAAMRAETVGNKILQALKQPYQLPSSEVSCTASIGITLFGEHKEEAIESLRRAELAMYQAKAQGRNRLIFFDPEMQAVVKSRIVMEAGLRAAVETNQFLLFYQPQVTGKDQITGVEALLRWFDPKRGMVSPAEFIPLAEETGLILPIGLWVLETACKQLVQWASQPGMAHLTIAVNVSARQFGQTDFVDQVLSTLHRTGANPLRLKLELTESMLVANVEEVILKMKALKGRGVGFSLDDFGTGYSSLSCLKRLPMDQLKIDQGFVGDILTDQNDAAIAKMVVALAYSLGLTVIAEGVETEEQRWFLASMGCDNYQGYLFSKPLAINELEALVN